MIILTGPTRPRHVELMLFHPLLLLLFDYWFYLSSSYNLLGLHMLFHYFGLGVYCLGGRLIGPVFGSWPMQNRVTWRYFNLEINFEATKGSTPCQHHHIERNACTTLPICHLIPLACLFYSYLCTYYLNPLKGYPYNHISSTP